MLGVTITTNAQVQAGSTANEMSRFIVAGLNFQIGQIYPDKITCLRIADGALSQDVQQVLDKEFNPNELSVMDNFYNPSLGKKFTDLPSEKKTTGRTLPFSDEEKIEISKTVGKPYFARMQNLMSQVMVAPAKVIWQQKLASCQ
jgi:hypothetical protein